ncbi:thioredoxin family protein [Paenibacillus tuaregi]|uniref:thioredoxin family protein n=1 Tax=Paenibacillus tuaregi TaxID=1816681 RepID=UPI0008399257|nr:thioredoxin family protein [Paenibacillus tuaregi]
MSLQEVTEQELLESLQDNSSAKAVYFYTGLCGTCQLGERMLEIALVAAPSIRVYKININYAPLLRDKWKISSVPALVLLEHGAPVQTEYAMRSVDHLYTLLTKHFSSPK